jgi:lytic murein transglycosylase B
MNALGWAARLPREARDTLFLVAVTAWTLLPHLLQRPAWLALGVAAVLGWRVHLVLRGAPLPGRWPVVALLGLAATATWWREGTLLGREAGVMLLVALMALKTLELRARRDAMVVFFLGFFLVLARFLDSQSLLTALGGALAVWGLLTALALAHMPSGRPPLMQAARVAGRAALLGTPLMVALFVLFPRVGPLWGLPSDAAGRTGLSGSMRLGEVAELAADESIALRVRFEGAAPPPSSLYFRGPVLSHFDGREWTRDAPGQPGWQRGWPRLNADLMIQGEPRPYEMTLEPSRLPLLPLLEITATAPQIDPPDGVTGLRRRSDLQWQTALPVGTRLSIRGQAFFDVRHGGSASPVALRDLVDLPPGLNPRTLAWAAQLRRNPRWTEADARTMVDVVLGHIRQDGFAYTMAPGTYGDSAIDEFWFDRKAGFCEHFAAAFVVVMRALDVPARIVTGYQGADPTPVDGWWVVRQSHAHAWAEVWQDGEGWLRVDPTAAVAPERVVRSANLRPAPGLIGQVLGTVNPDLLRQVRLMWERLDQRWNQWVLGWSRQQQMGLMRTLGVEAPDTATLSRVLVGLLAGVVALGAAWAWWSHRRQDPWLRLQQRVRKRLAKLGVAVADHDPPRRRAQIVHDRLGPAGAALAPLLLDLERMRYGMHDTADNRVNHGAERSAERRGGMCDFRPWWRTFRRACARVTRATTPPSAPTTGATTVLVAPLAAVLMTLAAMSPPGEARAAGSAVHTGQAPPGKASPASAAATPSKATPASASNGTRTPSKQAVTAPASAASPGTPSAAGDFTQRDELRRFIDELAIRRGWDRRWVEAQIAPARRLQRVRELIMPPPVSRPRDWSAYRARFVEPGRIEAGVAFWQAHRRWLDEAQARWGVPAWLVVGIIGVETHYGQFTGGFRVLDALATLAFDFPPGRSDRSDYFRSELEELLALAHHEGRDATTWRGSYAGALGLPQFMPGSINRWAVDFDGDGHVDLRTSVADAIGSVAHYLAAHGWQSGLPTHHGAEPPPPGPGRDMLLAPDIVPSFTAAQMQAAGARLDTAGRAHDADRDGLLALVRLDNGTDAPSFVAGTRNFWVVTRYNRSSYYALAVIELGQSVRDALP